MVMNILPLDLLMEMVRQLKIMIIPLLINFYGTEQFIID